MKVEYCDGLEMKFTVYHH